MDDDLNARNICSLAMVDLPDTMVDILDTVVDIPDTMVAGYDG